MKVVQLLPELNEGGVERGVLELNRELIARGIQSLVISAGGKLVDQIERDGGRHYTLDIAGKNILSVPARVRKLRQLIREIKPDLLHARSRVPAWLSLFANRPLKLPFVTTVHGFNSVNPYSRIMTCGDRVICVSEAIKEYIQRHYRVPEQKISIIPRGVDLELFDPTGIDLEFIRDFRRKFHLENRFVVATVGRVTQLKDLETFIDALVQVRHDIPHLTGLIVGGVRADKEEYLKGLKQRIADADAEDYISFTGSQARVAEIYALSDLVVSSSKKPESFGRSAAEAIAMGTPVLATGHGGILDIVLDRKTGLLFDVGDSGQLAEKIVSAEKMEWDGLRGHIQEHFSLEQMVEKTINVYQDLIKK